MQKHYAHLKDAIDRHYKSQGVLVEVDPPGRGAPDILGKAPNGRIIVGEIKSAAEAEGSASSWWSYWTKSDRDLRKRYREQPPAEPTATAGWCAVIDGQLRAYGERLLISEGDLVVEKWERHQTAVEKALNFLSEQGRVAHWRITNDSGLGFCTIRFI